MVQSFNPSSSKVATYDGHPKMKRDAQVKVVFVSREKDYYHSGFQAFIVHSIFNGYVVNILLYITLAYMRPFVNNTKQMGPAKKILLPLMVPIQHMYSP
jgi:hypothetical protein